MSECPYCSRKPGGKDMLDHALSETGGGTASDVEDPQERSGEASTPSTQAGSSFGVRAVKGIPRL